MYCTKLQHHTYTKIRTLSCRGIVEHHGIFWEKKHTTLYKSWLSPPAVTFCLHFVFFSSQKQTRVRFDSAFKSPVPRREMKEVEEEGPSALPSPPSRSASSGKEPPVEQDAEQSCAQAPPQRPLVPLVSMILEGQLKTERAQVRDALLVGFYCELYLRSAETHADGEHAEKGSTWTRARRNPDTRTMAIFSKQSASIQQQYAADWRPPFSGGESYTNPYGHAPGRRDRPANVLF